MPGPGGVRRRCRDRRISDGLPDARHGRCVSGALSGSEPATAVGLLGVNLDNRAVEESHRARGLAPPERPVLWICGRVLRTGANPAGRVDSPCATPRRCTPPDHTFAPLAHELHSINNTILIKKEKTKTVQSGSICWTADTTLNWLPTCPTIGVHLSPLSRGTRASHAVNDFVACIGRKIK